jgi:hypothetical protein
MEWNGMDLGMIPNHLDINDICCHDIVYLYTGVWIPLTDLLRSWANSSTIHVFLGSVLDTNRDGRRDSDADYTWWLGDVVGGVAIPTLLRSGREVSRQ